MKDSISISKNCLDVSFVRGDKNNMGVPRPEPMSREQIKNTYLNKSVAIDYAFYDVIELPAVNKIFTAVG